MKNIREVLDQAGNPGTGISSTLVENALKELGALEAAGIEVRIEQVEHVTVVKPGARRGGRRKKQAETK